MHLGGYLFAAPEHAVDHSWPEHAQFHIVQAIFWIAGLDITAALIGFFVLPSSERWVKWVLSFIFLTGHLSYFISMVIIPEGRPPEMTAHINLGVVLLVYFLGLVQVFRGGER